MVFGKAVQSVVGEPAAGTVVDVLDGAGSLIGWGVFNPSSMYRVRLLATIEPQLLEHRDLSILLRYRLEAAAQLRQACGLPSESTSAYRLVNSEGDRLSGLQVDVFARQAVAVSSALWVEQRREMVRAALLELDGIDEVVWRRNEARLKQDGDDGSRAERRPPTSAQQLPPPARSRQSQPPLTSQKTWRRRAPG